MIAAPCTAAAARAVIVRTHLRGKLNGDPGPLTPFPVDEVVCAGDTMAVTLASGGTAGDVGVVLFRRTPAGWKAALVRGGYKVGIIRAGADVDTSQPVYRKNDPNCCPTGGFDHVRLHWNGARFVVARAWHTKSFNP